jgi:Zn-dependent peptidase ImmA (M78 family)
VNAQRKALASQAASRALRLRMANGYRQWQPLSVLDLAHKIGVDVRFIKIPSMEGIYCQGREPTIIISSQRPIGRQNFTCAHELGHYNMGHGEQYDELVEQRNSNRSLHKPQEIEADSFASALLMPKIAVERAFFNRSVEPKKSTPESVFSISNWLGVGYTTLITHMEIGLGLLDEQHALHLKEFKLPAIKKIILGQECRENLHVVDEHWLDRAVDTWVSDLILLPPNVVVEGACIQLIETGPHRSIAQTVSPGIGRISMVDSTWATFVRVSKKEYEGRAIYRFEEDVDDE